MSSKEIDFSTLSSAKKKRVSSGKPVTKRKKKKTSEEDRTSKPKAKRSKDSIKRKSSKKSSSDAVRKKRPSKKKASGEIKVRKRKTITDLANSDELEKEFKESFGSMSVEERDQMNEYIYMFQQLSKISRTWTVKVQGDKAQSRDVYALLKIYDQMRELVADLKALKDMGEITGLIQDGVMNPLMKDVAGSITGIKTDLAEQYIDDPETWAVLSKAIDRSLRTIAFDLQESYTTSISSLRNLLASI